MELEHTESESNALHAPSKVYSTVQRCMENVANGLILMHAWNWGGIVCSVSSSCVVVYGFGLIWYHPVGFVLFVFFLVSVLLVSLALWVFPHCLMGGFSVFSWRRKKLSLSVICSLLDVCGG